MEELAVKALKLAALQRVAREEAWDARCRLEQALIRNGVPDEDAWCDTAMSLEEGDVTPEFTAEGFHIFDHDRFEQWATEHGFAHLEWVVDEEAALAQLDAANGTAYFDGEEVPGVWPRVAMPCGVSLHPSKAARKIVKEWVREHL